MVTVLPGFRDTDDPRHGTTRQAQASIDMILKKSTDFYRYLIFAASIIASLGVLNRWLVTDMGVLSYGRVWQLYISYADFGFVRRALLGTILSASGLNSILKNEYYFAILLHGAAILIFAAIIFSYITDKKINDIPLIATVALSPTLIIQSGYTTGSLDIFVLILTSLNILYCRNLFVFCLTLVLGVFLHELFVFTIPAQLTSYFMRQRDKELSKIHIMMPVFCILGSVLIIFFFGTTDVSREVVERAMAAKIPNAAYKHNFWSGYFEISASVSQNSVLSVGELADVFRHWMLFLSIPLVYVFLVTIRLARYAQGTVEKAALTASTLFPLLAALVATDLYRWIGLSASVGLVLTLQTAQRLENTKSKLTYVLLPFSLLAPFGASQAGWAFPMHQFIMESFFFVK